MRPKTYRYNTLTCRYERVKISAWNVLWYGLGLSVMASCMLLGIMLLHDLLVNTDNENRLRKENQAFKRHHKILSAELNTLQPVLTSLQNKDRVLHEKIFGVEPGKPADNEDRASKERLLLADAETFSEQVVALKYTSEKLIKRTAGTRLFFAGNLALTRDALETLHNLPTRPPVQAWHHDRLISGFGMRINPFHKGLYHHLGVDIAMPRGTPVIATGSGTVVKLKRSDLQAGYGNYIEIDHGKGLITRYAHLEDIDVKFGAKVLKGEVIGTVGTSGGSVAPHLHYEVIQDEKNMDPVYYIVEGLTSDEHTQLISMSHQQNQSLD